MLSQRTLAAADKPDTKPGDAMIDKYLADQTARVSQNVLDGAKSRDDWEARRPRLKQEYFEMLGLMPLPERTPLRAKVTGTLERDDFVVEKVHFQSKPGLYVTGNLYQPSVKASRELKYPEKLPAVLYVCGHSGKGRNGNKTAFQDHGMWFASNGYVCLIIDTLQLGEVAGIHHGTYGIRGKESVETRFWWQAAGYTPAGVECWNGVRAIDYLVSRPDVDADRIAVTGISGGGAATFWIAAADERVKCAVPVSGMSDLESYVSNKIINGHCDCMLMINTYGWEWTTIAALVAPRPLLFANSDRDPIFPMDGNRRIIERLRKLYKLYGKPELVDEYVSAGGHDYRPDLRVAIFQFINKHFKNDTRPVKDADFKPFALEELRVFPEDRDIPADALNGRIDETFVPRAVVKLPEEGKFEAWKADLMRELRAKSFRTFPKTIPNARELRTDDAKGRLLFTEPGIAVTLLDEDGPAGAKAGGVLIVLNPGEDAAKAPKPDAYGWCAWLAPRGHELSDPWTEKAPPNYVKRSHALVGSTVDQGRVRDIIAAARVADRKKEGIRVLGRGPAGVLAAYAALFEPSIKEVVIIEPPVSHREGPIFLNVLRVCDVPDALGMLAPRPLTLVNAKDKEFDRTAQIYKAAGAAEKLKRQ